MAARLLSRLDPVFWRKKCLHTHIYRLHTLCVECVEVGDPTCGAFILEVKKGKAAVCMCLYVFVCVCMCLYGMCFFVCMWEVKNPGSPEGKLKHHKNAGCGLSPLARLRPRIAAERLIFRQSASRGSERSCYVLSEPREALFRQINRSSAICCRSTSCTAEREAVELYVKSRTSR